MSNAKPTTDAAAAYWATTIAVGTHALLATAIVMALWPLEFIFTWWIYQFERMNAILPAATVLTIDLYLQCAKYWFVVPLLFLAFGAVDAWVFHRLFRRRALRFLAAAWFYVGLMFLLLFVIAIKSGLELPYLDWLENIR